MRNLFCYLVVFTLLCSCVGGKQGDTNQYTQIATGQVLCYNLAGELIDNPIEGDALYGQDANYLKGAAMSYTDKKNGTVVDDNTGLMWQQVPVPDGMTWAEAQEYCENLELGGHTDWRLPTAKELYSISNFSTGWPYIDTTYFKLATGRVTKDEQYWTSHKYTGETVEGRNDAAFGVNHVTGHIKAYASGSQRGGARPEGEQAQGEQAQRQRPAQGEQGQGEQAQRQRQRPAQGEQAQGEQAQRQRPAQGEQAQRQRQRPAQGEQGQGEQAQRQRPEGNQPPPQGNQAPQGATEGNMPPPNAGGGRPMGNPMAKQVRAVRGDVYGVNNFTDNCDGTISDTATGLMWSKDDSSVAMEWSEALVYAEGATLAGYDDWRLPNVKELQGIVNYTKAPTSERNEAAIDDIFNCTPFINEAGDDDYQYYWTSTSACFRSSAPYYYAWYVAFGRAVNGAGLDFHGAGAVRFDVKSNSDIAVEGDEERYFNMVRMVRNI